MFTIYQRINFLSGKSYIGFTSRDPEKRWIEHVQNARRGKIGYLYNAIRKDGPEVFLGSILEEGWDPNTGKNIREPYWISVLKPEYNNTYGGEGAVGYKRRPEQNAAIGARMTGKKNALGYKYTPEQRSARSRRMMGNSNGKHNRGSLGLKWKCTEKQNQEKSMRMMGHKHSEKTILAMSIAANKRKRKLQ